MVATGWWQGFNTLADARIGKLGGSGGLALCGHANATNIGCLWPEIGVFMHFTPATTATEANKERRTDRAARITHGQQDTCIIKQQGQPVNSRRLTVRGRSCLACNFLGTPTQNKTQPEKFWGPSNAALKANQVLIRQAVAMDAL